MLGLANVHLLMCRPAHFGVTYAINPWMDPTSWARDVHGLTLNSQQEWAALHRTFIGLGAAIEMLPSVTGLPDLVFTANAAVVLDRTALLARFRHPERQREEPYFEAAFQTMQRRGLIDAISKMPDNLVLEGAGDCVWDQTRKLFWMGYGQRSDAASIRVVKDTFGAEVIALELSDPRFYHMDTALCALPRGEVMYFSDAFTQRGRAEIDERVTPYQRVQVGIDDACQLAANAVCIGNIIIMSGCGEYLRAELTERGYRVVIMPLRTYLRSGGSACCLTLRLDNRSSHGSITPGISRRAPAIEDSNLRG
jgi:N-dimethylarginine dimethylaminohydrolase